ncbi:helix-turn-helix domain-containing protein [Streptomyces sp. NPDC007070]|uniref:helix-turn-helix domain-containing protein n=1 Tax=Streptomyces sp. NPDC007070 TaxID=3154312 RepID=UPI0033C0F14A
MARHSRFRTSSSSPRWRCPARGASRREHRATDAGPGAPTVLRPLPRRGGPNGPGRGPRVLTPCRAEGVRGGDGCSVRGRRRAHPDDDHRKDRVVEKGKQITGTARAELAREMRKQYEQGMSIRAIAEEHGRSYGFVHRVLTETEVPLRARGGNHSPQHLQDAGGSRR